MADTTRRTLLAGMARLSAAFPLIHWSRAMAQQRVPRIGFMSGAEPSLIASFDDEMRKLGYSLGKDIEIELRIGRMYTSDTAAHAAELGAMTSTSWSSPRCRKPWRCGRRTRICRW